MVITRIDVQVFVEVIQKLHLIERATVSITRSNTKFIGNIARCNLKENGV